MVFLQEPPDTFFSLQSVFFLSLFFWFILLSEIRAMATLHRIDYLTPSIVSLAAKKVYRHRISVARTEDDRSLQYGSQMESVEMLLRGVDADQIIDTVISEVESPL